MRIILLQDVAKIGKKYEVKEVKNGLARNLLIPQGKAELATLGALQKIKAVREKREKETVEETKTLEDIFAALENKTVTVHAKASGEGTLFAALTEKDIAKAITDVAVTPELIMLKEPIKKTGEYVVEVGTGEKRGELKINILNIE